MKFSWAPGNKLFKKENANDSIFAIPIGFFPHLFSSVLQLAQVNSIELSYMGEINHGALWCYNSRVVCIVVKFF